jgi:hypothetical protein
MCAGGLATFAREFLSFLGGVVVAAIRQWCCFAAAAGTKVANARVYGIW